MRSPNRRQRKRKIDFDAISEQPTSRLLQVLLNSNLTDTLVFNVEADLQISREIFARLRLGARGRGVFTTFCEVYHKCGIKLTRLNALQARNTQKSAKPHCEIARNALQRAETRSQTRSRFVHLFIDTHEGQWHCVKPASISEHALLGIRSLIACGG